MRLVAILAVISALIMWGGVADSLAQQRVVKSGHTVRLQLPDESFVGRIVSIERDTVSLVRTLDSPTTRFALNDIRTIELRIPGYDRTRRTLGGALIGAGVGTAGGLYLSTHVPCVDCVVTRRDQVVGTLLFAGIFSVIGGAAGFVTTRGQWVPAQIQHLPATR